MSQVCRIWHGRTPRNKADAYEEFLRQRAVADYRSVEPEVQHFAVCARSGGTGGP